jgi:hypothetical protein
MYERMNKLVGRRLIHVQRNIDGPRLYSISRYGIAHVGLGLTAPKVSNATFRHELAIVDVARQLDMTGTRYLTEREIRASPTGQDKYTVRIHEASRSSHHWPDLVVEAGAELWAVEVELTHKKLDRLKSIIAGYARRDPYAKTCYFVRDHRLAQKIQTVAHDRDLQWKQWLVVWDVERANLSEHVNNDVQQKSDDRHAELSAKLSTAEAEAQRWRAEFDAWKHIFEHLCRKRGKDRDRVIDQVRERLYEMENGSHR